MEEEAVWDALPQEEHKSVWNETERDFWENYEKQHNSEQAAADKDYNVARTDTKVQLGVLNGKRTQLSQDQVRLAKELVQVEEELARVRQEYNDETDKLERIELDYRNETQARLETKAKVQKTMTRFFREKRGENSEAADERRTNGFPRPEPTRNRPQATSSPRVNGSRRRLPSNGPSSHGDVNRRESGERTPARDEEIPIESLVDIVDTDGNVIGPVQKIEPWNQWVKAIQELPIQRPVKIRRGRKFTETHLSTVYERTEAKGVKWLSCMIQAIGDVQTKRCQSCEKNQGAFDDCIIIGGDLFQKCGNCEWNRQGCHGSSGESMDGVETFKRRYRHNRDQSRGNETEVRTMGESQPAVPGTPGAHDSSQEEEIVHSHNAPTNRTPDGLPSRTKESAIAAAKGVNESSSNITTNTNAKESERAVTRDMGRVTNHRIEIATPNEPKITPGFTPANIRSRQPSLERQTPASNVPVDASPQPTESLPDESYEEITKDNLILRHNGEVYTYPDCVVGVPVVKIDENHPYWEPNWQNVREQIMPQLERWRGKLQEAIEAEGLSERKGSSKYQIGRQVNRGLKILEFLDEGTISPYQLLSKRHIASGKGGICSYDTVFRLAETVSELSKFKLKGITPIDWIRQRLHEIIQVDGPNFNLPKIMHDFYHDPKLKDLRTRHGFKNIGRPSGMKLNRPSMGDSPAGTPKASLKKRKSMHSLAGSPQEATDGSPLLTPAPILDSPFSTHLNKRPKYSSSPTPETAVHDEFHTKDFSDTDSWCGAELTEHDWRIYQVKTRLFTSSANITQYWTWKGDRSYFEYQVLKDDKPPEWGLMKPPIDFNVKFNEISQVIWSIDAMRVHIIMRVEGSQSTKVDGKPRGDVMAAFKRKNTMRRFLHFCRDMGVKMLKESDEEVQHRWVSMQSEQLKNEADSSSTTV